MSRFWAYGDEQDADMFDSGDAARRRRADAERNASRVLSAAVRLLRASPDASLEEIAAAAGVSRATVYRHFGSRARLADAALTVAREHADANETDTLRPAGELAGGPTPLDVADVLNKVPPHLIGEQIVAEAQRLAGVTSVALYLVDIDGTRLLRLAGSREFPSELPVPLGVGPELPREGLPALRDAIRAELPRGVVAPLLLRGRALGVLLGLDAPEAALLALARHAAASLELATAYTDVIDAARRRRETTAAAELQESLLPPRIARMSGGSLAATVLPGYELGGDWFDYVENSDGAWLGVADTVGTGTTAAAVCCAALGAFRARRKFTSELPDVARAMHGTLLDLALEGTGTSAVIARWHGPSSVVRWISCGSAPPLLVRADGELEPLEEDGGTPLGQGPRDRTFTVVERRLERGERLLLLTDGVMDRPTNDGGRFGLDGVRRAVAAAPGATPAAIVRALQDALMTAVPDPLGDDATVLVFAPSDRR